jgi:RND family efflux transporter MFP subunit
VNKKNQHLQPQKGFTKTSMNMKISLSKILALSALFAFACSGKTVDDSLEEKKQQLEALKKQALQVQQQISALEKEIAEISGPNTKAALRNVEVMALAPTTFEHFIEVRGDVQSDQNVMVNPETNGIVLARKVEEGQMVRKGQVILEIDAELVRRNLAELETRLSLAKTIYERQANLWKQQIGSEVQYLQAKNNMESLEKSIQSVKVQLDNAYVKSPIDGTLDQFFVNKGEMVSISSPVARVVNLNSVEVFAEVSEAFATSIKKGDAVQVHFPSLGITNTLRIDKVGQVINPNNRTFRITMKAQNPNGYLRPNTLAVVTIKDFTQDEALLVPSNLIQKSTSGESFLFRTVKKEGQEIVERVVVESGRSYGGKTLITSGLKPGDRVITKGYNEVLNGEAVQVSAEIAI